MTTIPGTGKALSILGLTVPRFSGSQQRVWLIQEPFSTILVRCFLIYGGRWTRQRSCFRKMQSRDFAAVQVERVANHHRKLLDAKPEQGAPCSARGSQTSVSPRAICLTPRLDRVPEPKKGGPRVFVPLSRVSGKTEVVLALFGAFVPLSRLRPRKFPCILIAPLVQQEL